MEKSAQPVSEVPAEEEFHPDNAEGDEEDKGEETDGLEVEAIDVPVSIGMSSKLAVHTGPKEREGWWNGRISCYAFVQDFSLPTPPVLQPPSQLLGYPTCVNFHSVLSVRVGSFKWISLVILFL